MATSQLMERLPDIKDAQLGIIAGISTDKAELLAGQPTARIEVSMAPAADQWLEFVAGLKQQQAREAGEVIDVAFQPIGLAAGVEKQEYGCLVPTGS